MEFSLIQWAKNLLYRLFFLSIIYFIAQIVSHIASGSHDIGTLALVSFDMSPSLLEHFLLFGTRCSKLTSSPFVQVAFVPFSGEYNSKPRYGRPRILNRMIGELLTKGMACKWGREVVGTWVS